MRGFLPRKPKNFCLQTTARI